MKLQYPFSFFVMLVLFIWIQHGAGVDQKSTVAIETLRPKLQVISTLVQTIVNQFFFKKNKLLYLWLLLSTSFTSNLKVRIYYGNGTENSSSTTASSKTCLYILTQMLDLCHFKMLVLLCSLLAK